MQKRRAKEEVAPRYLDRHLIMFHSEKYSHGYQSCLSVTLAVIFSTQGLVVVTGRTDRRGTTHRVFDFLGHGRQI